LARFSLERDPLGTKAARESKGLGDVPDGRNSSHGVRRRRVRTPPDDDRRTARGAPLAALHGDAVPDRGEGVLGPAGEEDRAGGNAAGGAARGLSQVDHVLTATSPSPFTSTLTSTSTRRSC